MNWETALKKHSAAPQMKPAPSRRRTPSLLVHVLVTLPMNAAYAVAPAPSSWRVCLPPRGLTPRRARSPQHAPPTPRQSRPHIPLMASRPSPSDEERATAAAATSHSSESHDSYLQCVECSALYVVEPEELEGAPRVVGCSTCLHEWYASEADLLWGEDEALAALTEDNSFESRTRRTREDGRKAFAFAQGFEGKKEQSFSARLRDGRKEGKNREERKGEDEMEVGKRKTEPAKVETEGRGGEREGEEEPRFNVFVGNLSFRATEEDLYRAFSGYGAVLKCQVPADSSGASRGYGFVEMRSRESGLRAIDSLQGTSILGRDVSLNEARPKKDYSTIRKQQARAGWGARDNRRSRDFVSRTSGDARPASGFRRDKKQKESAQDRLKSSKKA